MKLPRLVTKYGKYQLWEESAKVKDMNIRSMFTKPTRAVTAPIRKVVSPHMALTDAEVLELSALRHTKPSRLSNKELDRLSQLERKENGEEEVVSTPEPTTTVGKVMTTDNAPENNG